MHLTCSKCEAKVTSRDKFCRQCGEPLMLYGATAPEADQAAMLCDYARRLAEYSKALRATDPLVTRTEPPPSPPRLPPFPTRTSSYQTHSEGPLPQPTLSPPRIPNTAGRPRPQWARPASPPITQAAIDTLPGRGARAASPASSVCTSTPSGSKLLDRATINSLCSAVRSGQYSAAMHSHYAP
eukprot:TRINITY_DN6728_c0_g1_i1.p1 TRINITY_DN6728_c0_g1~~TRINITY_DN6728_c0_g1_i1.p1  ORF type:complete len:183 (+),score=39.51 TRINITY_DN6728_c0_g1_i1:147-695(+)